jgi:hypothetical protein
VCTVSNPRSQRETGDVKTLVWFWWIDESANLVYQSDHEIGSMFQVVKQMVMIMMMV